MSEQVGLTGSVILAHTYVVDTHSPQQTLATQKYHNGGDDVGSE